MKCIYEELISRRAQIHFWSKIGLIKCNTQIYWSSHESRKILGETVSRAQYSCPTYGETNKFVYPMIGMNPILSLLCSKNLVSEITVRIS